MPTKLSVLFLLLATAPGRLHAVEPLRGYQKKVPVSAATSLDWTFALANQSVDPPPADWLPADFDSTRQSYELFVPPDYNPRQTYPVILFISAGNEPAGWKQWEPVCKQHGVIFASPFAAGNNTPPKQRVRIVLDVLDDLRRLYRVDPDRTYLAGFSGGARIACGIAFALPEYFGGVVPVCAGGNLREESWLRQRVIDRLSVALVTGQTDFNRGEIERFRGPLLQEVGVRCKVWLVPKMGHAIPGNPTLSDVFRWLEEGVKARRDLAQRWPAMRHPSDTSPKREDQARALLAEARQRLQKKESLYAGLMQLKGCMTRWEGLPPAAEARKLLLEYDARPERPWEADDLAEQRRFLLATARGLAAYASGPLPSQYANQREQMARQALGLWQQIQADLPRTPADKEAQKRIAELQKIVDKKP
jgi:poly(3-hydroxybutyrate) depolymerase